MLTRALGPVIQLQWVIIIIVVVVVTVISTFRLCTILVLIDIDKSAGMNKTFEAPAGVRNIPHSRL